MAAENSSGAHSAGFSQCMMFREPHTRPSMEARLLVVALGLFLASVVWEVAVARRQTEARRQEAANRAGF